LGTGKIQIGRNTRSGISAERTGQDPALYPDPWEKLNTNRKGMQFDPAEKKKKE